MEKRKPNLVSVVFSMIGAVIVTVVGILKGLDFFLYGTGTQAQLGQGTMYLIVAALFLIGSIFASIAEFIGRKDASLIGILINAIGFTIFLILETNETGISSLSAITYFAYSVIKLITVYLDKKGLKVVAFILSAITLFALVISGTVGLYITNFHFYYVALVFGYVFVGIGLFVDRLFDLIGKKPE